MSGSKKSPGVTACASALALHERTGADRQCLLCGPLGYAYATTEHRWFRIQRRVVEREQPLRILHHAEGRLLPEGDVDRAEHLGADDVRAPDRAAQPVLAQIGIQ